MSRYSVLSFTLIIIALISYWNGHAMDNYTHAELLQARCLFLSSPMAVRQVLRAIEITESPSSIALMNIYRACSYHIAQVNATTQTVKTFLSNGLTVDLSYAAFKQFMQDKQLYEEAYSLYQDEQPVTMKSNISFSPAFFIIVSVACIALSITTYFIINDLFATAIYP